MSINILIKILKEVVMDTNNSSYVVPISILSAFIVNTEQPDTLNDTIIELLKKTNDNIEIKKIFAETSKRLTEVVSSIDSNISILLVPNAFIPVKDKNESEIAVDFVEKFNQSLHEYLAQNPPKNE